MPGRASTGRKFGISKGDSTFCYPEYVPREMAKLFEVLAAKDDTWTISKTLRARPDLATLNAIHTFHDGNGRSQLAFMGLIARSAGHQLHLNKIVPADFLAAMIRSFQDSEELLALQLARLI